MTIEEHMVSYAQRFIAVLCPLYAAIMAVYYYLLHRLPDQLSILRPAGSTALGVVGLAVFLVLWRQLTSGADKDLKWKLFPFAVLPFAFVLLCSRALYSVVNVLGDNTSWVVYSLVEVAAYLLTMALGLTLFMRWVRAYVPVFWEKHTLIFPPSLGLSKKVWFAIAAMLAYALPSVTAPFVIDYAFGASKAGSLVQGYVLLLLDVFFYILFFHIAFKNIDAETRRLFYPLIFTADALNTLLGYLTAFLPSRFFGTAGSLTEILDSSDIEALLPQFILFAVYTVIALLGTIAVFRGIWRSLRVYEKEPEYN